MEDQQSTVNEKAVVSVVLAIFTALVLAYYFGLFHKEAKPDVALTNKLVKDDEVLGHAQRGDEYWGAWLQTCEKSPSSQGCDKVIRVKEICTQDRSLQCKGI